MSGNKLMKSCNKCTTFWRFQEKCVDFKGSYEDNSFSTVKDG